MAGSEVKYGNITKSFGARLLRDDEIIFDGRSNDCLLARTAARVRLFVTASAKVCVCTIFCELF